MPSTHTPGPWAVYFDDDGVEIRGDGDVMGMTINGSEMESNAHLIAAAPELLDMLKTLHKNRKELPTEMQWQRASELIAKAEGGAA